MEQIIKQVIDAAIPILGSALAGLVMATLHKTYKYIETITAIKIDNKLRSDLDGFAYDAIKYAEECAHSLNKSGIKVMSGKDKLDLAVATVMRLGKKHNLDAARAKELVLTTLSSTR